MGVSSVTGPTPNKGYEAQAIQRLGGIAKQLYEMLPMIGFNSELGKAIGKMLDAVRSHLPQGGIDQTAQQNNLRNMMLKNAQNMGTAQQLRPPQGGGGQMPPGGPPMPGGGAASGMAP